MTWSGSKIAPKPRRICAGAGSGPPILTRVATTVTIDNGLRIKGNRFCDLTVRAGGTHDLTVQLYRNGPSVGRRQGQTDLVRHPVTVAGAKDAVDDYRPVGTLHQDSRHRRGAKHDPGISILAAIFLPGWESGGLRPSRWGD